jgi:hypothetical protein
MKEKDNQYKKDRMKDLFATIEMEKPAPDFTLRVMQKIATEKVVITKRENPYKWLLYATPFIAMFIVTMVYLPTITGWINKISFTIPTTYVVYIKDIGQKLITSTQSLIIPPAVIAIIGSCSILLTLFGLTYTDQIVKEDGKAR